MTDFVIEFAARGFEMAGIAVMAVGTVGAIVFYLRQHSYDRLRRSIARSILLGLELLIASDIIATITMRPTLQNVAVLGLIVLIRTFLSFTLEVEANGRFPWQARGEARGLDKRP